MKAQSHGGWLWCLGQVSEFEAALIQVANAGGDTDTNGTLAGAIMGSRTGLAGIPWRWLGSVRDTGHLTALADLLYGRSEGL